MKTLFITDLDGTLLRSDKTISKESCELLLKSSQQKVVLQIFSKTL